MNILIVMQLIFHKVAEGLEVGQQWCEVLVNHDPLPNQGTVNDLVGPLRYLGDYTQQLWQRQISQDCYSKVVIVQSWKKTTAS